MQPITVALDRSSYPIYIGAGLFDQLELLIPKLLGQQILIVTNQTVAPLYLGAIQKACQTKHCQHLILPDGEQHKNLATLNQIFDCLLAHKYTRAATLIALGGGVIGDMTGFAAACYMRGVRYLQFPTTLLAQVDAAIGGKTAVNHPLGKNMLGAFYQPAAVISDTNTLNSLPQRVFCEGIAEVIKYGLIYDADFFVWLEQNMSQFLQKEPAVLQYAIQRCCEIKASIVMQDEREQGVRALLNFGHTFGHAIETGLGYGTWLHGEAVAIGMLIATDLSYRMGWVDVSLLTRVKNLLMQIGLPINLPKQLAAERLLELMNYDKKNIDGRLRLILLQTLGQGVVTEEVPLNLLEATVKTHNGV